MKKFLFVLMLAFISFSLVACAEIGVGKDAPEISAAALLLDMPKPAAAIESARSEATVALISLVRSSLAEIFSLSYFLLINSSIS